MPRALKAVFPMYWKWTTAAGARCWACPAVALPGRVAVAAPGGPGAARLFPQQPIRSLFRRRRVFRIAGWQAKGLLAGQQSGMQAFDQYGGGGPVSYTHLDVYKRQVFNNPPIVNNDTYNIRPNQVLSVTAPGLLANDSDPDGDPLTVVALDLGGLRGSITPFADGHFSFTPTAGFAGTTSFKYTVSDGAGGTATGTTTINVVNSSPVAVNDSYAVYAGRTLEVAAPGLLGNDSDADGDALTVKLADVTGLQGSISLLADGHFLFTPKAGFTGRTSFSYATSDGFGGTATATAAIDVVPIPTTTVSIGNAPERQSGLGGQWAAAWTNADIVASIVHKPDYTNTTETWSAARLNGCLLYTSRCV